MTQRSSAPRVLRTGLYYLSSLDIRIVGCGAIGHACGYLISRAGHHPTHVSLTGRMTSAVPVVLQDGTIDLYAPRMEGGAGKVDAILFAVGPGQVAEALAVWGAGAVPSFVFCSHPEPNFGTNLVSPLMSAELCPKHGLGVIRAGGVEISLWADDVAVRLLQRLGFGPVRRVSEAHFRGRALQTAAAYVVLLALSQARLDASEVRAALMLEIHRALSDVLQADGWAFHLPDDTDLSFAALAAYLGAPRRARVDVFARNLAALMGPGQRKLHSHLAPFRKAWERRAARSGNLGWKLIDDAFRQAANA